MRNLKGILYAIISSATFGLVPLFSLPLLHAGMASPTILFYRMGLSALIMGVLMLVSGCSFHISWRDFGVLAALSSMYAATSLGLLRSYDYIPSGVATTVNFLYPLVVTIALALFFREKSSIWVIVSVLISLVGVALLAWGDAGHNDPVRGLAFAASTIFSYAIYIIGVMKSRAARLNSLVVAFYVLTFAASIFLIYALSSTGIAVVHTWDTWRNLLLLALLPTVLSNLTLVLAIKEIGSLMTSILGSMEPLTAVLIGVAHFGERFNIDAAAGLILVILSVIIVILQTHHIQTSTADIPTQPQE
ncbi:MAG: DMT family transporter [Alistipes sp.]